MPREVTTLTGADFDIDKMFIMLKEWAFEDEMYTDKEFDNLWYNKYFEAYPEERTLGEQDPSKRNEITVRAKE
jgi:hypothetical protein